MLRTPQIKISKTICVCNILKETSPWKDACLPKWTGE